MADDLDEFEELPECEPAWLRVDRATAYRKRLLAAGYLPLPVNGKAPPIRGGFFYGAIQMASGKSTAYSRMPDDLLEAVAHAAARNERSMSAELRTLVREGYRLAPKGKRPMRHREELDTDPYLLTVREAAAAELALSPRHLKRLILNGAGPAAITVGGSYIRIRRADLDAYKAQRTVAA